MAARTAAAATPNATAASTQMTTISSMSPGQKASKRQAAAYVKQTMANQDLEPLRGTREAFAASDLEADATALVPQVRRHAAEEPDAEGTCPQPRRDAFL